MKLQKKKAYLDKLFYDVGRQAKDFRVWAQWLTKDGEVKSTKWRRYLDAQADEKFLAKVNNRTLLPCEVVLDYDEPSERFPTYESLLDQLEKDGLCFEAWATEDGRARHVYLVFPELAALTPQERRCVREAVIKKYGCDVALASDEHGIPLEGFPHWKTGKVTRCVRKKEGLNSVQPFLEELRERQRRAENEERMAGFIFDEDKVLKHRLFPFCKLTKDVAGFGLFLPKNVERWEGDKFRGVEQRWVPVIIGSDGQLYEVGSELESRFRIKIPVIPSSENYQLRWSLSSIRAYLEGRAPVIDGKALFSKIVGVYEKFLYFSSPTWYKVHALWDIGTYFFLLCKYYPLMELRGLKGTAKTKIMTVSRQMTFNATEELTNPSEATLFRMTNDNRPTKYIDEAEKLFVLNRGRLESDPRVELINSGYKYTGAVPRMEKFGNKYRSVLFHTYSPTMLGSINGLYGATEDRAIIHTTVKPPKGDNRGELEPDEADSVFQQIRDELYLFALQNWKRFEEACQQEIETSLKDRDLNLWKPLLSLAILIDSKLFDEVRLFAEKCAEIKGMDIIPEGSLQHRLLETVYALLREGCRPVMVRDVWLRFPGSEEKKPSKRRLTRELDRLGFRDFKRHFRDGSGYDVSFEVFSGIVAPISPSILSSPQSPQSQNGLFHDDKTSDEQSSACDYNPLNCDGSVTETIGADASVTKKGVSVTKKGVSVTQGGAYSHTKTAETAEFEHFSDLRDCGDDSDATYERRGLLEHVLVLVKKLTEEKGGAVSFQEIFEAGKYAESGYSDEMVFGALRKLAQQGDVYESEPDKWRVLA